MTWAISVMMPANTEAITINRTSRLMTWVISWASTASSSRSSRACMMPVVTVTLYWPSCRPVAKAFMASVWMTLSAGVRMPRDTARFSSML